MIQLAPVASVALSALIADSGGTDNYDTKIHSIIYPPALPIDSTRPLPFVSVLIISVNVLNAPGFICTICSSAPFFKMAAYSFPFLASLLLFDLLTLLLYLLPYPLGIFPGHRNSYTHPHSSYGQYLVLLFSFA
jgi:hypothetical protein